MMKTMLLVAVSFIGTAGWCGSLIPDCQERERTAELAWSQERWLDARNEWTRLLEWDRLNGGMTGAQRREMSALRDEANYRWIASLPAPATLAPVVEEIPMKKPRHRRAVSAEVFKPAAAASVEEIMGKAQAAREAGQLESALRLFRIAAARPGGEAAATAVAELEAEIGQPER